MALTDLPVRGDMNPVNLSATLGRRWRKDHADVWRRLSPLGTGRAGVSHDEAETTPPAADPEAEEFVARLRQPREAQLDEARRDSAVLKATRHEADLRLSAINGSMDDHDDDVEKDPWR